MTEQVSQADRLVEAVARATVFTVDRLYIGRKFVWYIHLHNGKKGNKGREEFDDKGEANVRCRQLNAQAAIAAVIAHVTSPDAIARACAARETYIGARMNPHDGESMKAAITAALTGGQ